MRGEMLAAYKTIGERVVISYSGIMQDENKFIEYEKNIEVDDKNFAVFANNVRKLYSPKVKLDHSDIEKLKNTVPPIVGDPHPYKNAQPLTQEKFKTLCALLLK